MKTWAGLPSYSITIYIDYAQNTAPQALFTRSSINATVHSSQNPSNSTKLKQLNPSHITTHDLDAKACSQSAGYIIIFLLKEGEGLAKFKISYVMFYTSVVIICLNTKDDFLSHQLEYWLWAKAPLLSWKLLDHTIPHKREQRSLDNHNCKNQNLVGFYKRSCHIFQRYSRDKWLWVNQRRQTEKRKKATMNIKRETTGDF